MFKKLSVLLVLVFVGCTPGQNILSGSFSISGDLSNHMNKDCSVSLAASRSGLGRIFGRAPVTGKFEQQFQVSSQSRDYYVIVNCNDNVIHRQMVTYQGSVTKDGTVSLGVL